MSRRIERTSKIGETLTKKGTQMKKKVESEDSQEVHKSYARQWEEDFGLLLGSKGLPADLYGAPTTLCCLSAASQQSSHRRLPWPPGSVPQQLSVRLFMFVCPDVWLALQR